MQTVPHTKRVSPRKAARPTAPRRRRIGLVAILLAALGAIGSVPPVASALRPAQTIADKREEARRLQAAIEANGERISMLAEEYNGVQAELEELRDRLADAERRAGLAREEQGELRVQLADRAAALYRGAGGTPLATTFDSESITEAGARTKYAEVASERDADLIDRYGAAREALAEYSDDLEQQREALAAEEDRLAAAQAEINARNEEQEQLLSQVQGDIQRLIREEEARRAAEERRRAAAEAARLAAERAAAADDGAGSGAVAPPADDGGDSGGDGGSGPAPTAPPTTAPPVDPGGGGNPASNPRAQIAVDAAMAQIGTPYIYAQPRSWSDPDPAGFDCSGLTGWAWAKAGVMLPHHSGTQYATLPKVSQDSLQPGDLVFYGSPIHHVGMYIGGGMMVEAPHTGALVRTRSIFRSDYAGAARPG